MESAVPYLADYEQTSPEAEDMGDQTVHDYDPNNYPSSSASTVVAGESDTGHQHQQTDIPLQLSDILPIDRRSYDKMEPPKKEGNDVTRTT